MLELTSLIGGLILLFWSADKFVDGAAGIARHFNMPPLLIGMIIVGFGTSAPEMLVSALSSLQGNSGIALGNAYGSNIANIALILGVAALISPIKVDGDVVKKELPILSAATLLSVILIWNGLLSRIDAAVLIVVFFIYMGYEIASKKSNKNEAAAKETKKEAKSIGGLFFELILGLFFLVASSKALVWGSVKIARFFHVSDLIIGLTIVAIGTSLPELASSVVAARKGEDDIALGNVIGSNLFNTLLVVGIACVIKPAEATPELLKRDMVVMALLTLSLFIFGKDRKIKRSEGFMLLFSYLLYTVWLVFSAVNRGC